MILDIGAYAERAASRYLDGEKRLCYLANNFKTRHGEVDLIFRNRKTIIFVEVKARSEKTFAPPKDYVEKEKQKRIIAASEYYLEKHPMYQKLTPRYDIIEVYFENNEIKSIKHLENAFTLD